MIEKKSAEIPKMLVDTGAEFTWINSDTLKSIGVKREKKDYTFVMANGNQITRAVGYAILRVGDAVTIDEVIFGEPGDLEILGARHAGRNEFACGLACEKTRGGRAGFGSSAEGCQSDWKE
ncbi:MAG: aspartyl protease family protein [Limisphaerales bacterium]